jgi:hypothetical protein
MIPRAPRRPVALSVTLTTPARRHATTIHDVAEGGVRVAGGLGLAPGDRVTLTTPGLVMGASVRWTRREASGLAFDRTLTPGELRDLLEIAARHARLRSPARLVTR